MKTRVNLVALSGVLAIAACGPIGTGGDDDSLDAGLRSVSELIGPTGGSVAIDNGAGVGIPQGALDSEVSIRVREVAEAPSPLPGTDVAAGKVVEFTPHGQLFNVPVTINLPFDATSVVGLRVLRLPDDTATEWAAVAGATFDQGMAYFETSAFSFYVVSHSDVDAGLDAGAADGDVDAAHDGGQVDTGSDAAHDGGQADVGVDAAADAALDAGPDEGGTDAAHDAGPADAATDAANDAGITDSASDAATDAGPADVAHDAGPVG